MKNLGCVFKREYLLVLSFILFTTVIGLTSLYSYTLFHFLIEIAVITISFGIYVIAWNTRQISGNSYFLFLGIAYFFIALLELLHMLSYEVINVFKGFDLNLPTSLWIAARYLQSISLLAALFFMRKKINPYLTFFIYSILLSALIFLIFSKIFPVCYISNEGLTPFKKISEYFICIIFLIGGVILYIKRKYFDQSIVQTMYFSILFLILAELTFTLYKTPHDIFNLTGHIFILTSFFLVYQCLVVKGLKDPVSLLFQDIINREKELETAMTNIKTLKGLLPICLSCKKIRDDNGYWQQVELYIAQHSAATFSHGMCPDCCEKYIKEANLDSMEEDLCSSKKPSSIL